MTKVLIVCLGNICRSPMAEGLMQKDLAEHAMAITVDSAGTSSWEKGNQPHPGTQKVLQAHGIDSSQMFSRQVTKSDFVEYDWILAMDRQNLADLKAIAPKELQYKLHLFLSVLPELKSEDVPDPWYTGDFNETQALILQALPKWRVVFE